MKLSWIVSLCLAGAWAMLGATGCSSVAPSDQRRSDSFKPYANRVIDGDRIDRFLQRRAAVVYAGVHLENVAASSDGETHSVTATAAEKGGTVSQGTATPVDARGYFITAAHCVEASPITIVFLKKGAGRDELCVAANPRVVWRGDRSKGQDLAVVSVDRAIDYYYEWGGEPKEGDEVIAASVNSTEGSDFEQPTSIAGKVLAILASAKIEQPALESSVYHEAPLRDGDSGGALLGLNGRLMGINTASVWNPEVRLISYHGMALRPNLDWLREIIDRDVQGQKNPVAVGAR